MSKKTEGNAQLNLRECLEAPVLTVVAMIELFSLLVRLGEEHPSHKIIV